MNIFDKMNGVEYDELLEILASDDDGEMTIAELQDITGWKKEKVIKMIKRLIYIKAITGRMHMGKQKVFFNSVNTTPYYTQKSTYYTAGTFTAGIKGLMFGNDKNGKNKKVTRVIQCPKCQATKQVLGGNIVKCDYCGVPMETKPF